METMEARETRERWRKIEEAIESEEAEGEVEHGHDEVAGGSETPPAEEPDELTPDSTGEGGEPGEGSEAVPTRESEVAIEVPPGATATPQEVEGFLEGEDRLMQEGEEGVGVEAIEVPEVVFGSDDRVRVWNTRSFPWRTICHLYIRARNGRTFLGTGEFIGPRVVLTAGHCLYMHNDGGWARSIVVTPGRNGSSSRPFDSVTATRFRSVHGWVAHRNSNYDYGIIILPSTQPGGTIGWMGLANLSFGSLLGLNVNTSGYPADKPYGTQWWNANNILAVTSRRLYYRVDTYGGQSGSPVWRYRNGYRHIVGIHTTGSSFWNGATRLCYPVFKNLVAWKGL